MRLTQAIPREELLTPKSFTRERAIKLLEEFSRGAIARWLVRSKLATKVEASGVVKLLTQQDTMGLAISRFKFLSHPFGKRDSWSPVELAFHNGAIAAFLAKVPSEMCDARMIDPGQYPVVEAERIARERFNAWAMVFDTPPKKGSALTHRQLLRLVFQDCILPRVEGMVEAFNRAHRRHLMAGPNRMSKSEFFGEFLASQRLDDSARRVPIREVDGWRFSPA